MLGRILSGPALSLASLGVLLLFVAVLYGRQAYVHDWFPEPAFKAFRLLRDELSGEPAEYLVKSNRESMTVGHSQGLTLISTVSAKGELTVNLIDGAGHVVHRWNTDWFRIWPGAEHVPGYLKPKERPGTEVEGMVLFPNGDLTFNFEGLGMVQIDGCSRLKWRLARLAHHSLIQDEAGNFWAPSMIVRDKKDARLPNYKPPFRDFTLIQVSPQGRLLREISVTDLLLANNLQGLLYLATQDKWSTRLGGDTLHLNDIDIFPSNLKPGVAKAGDLMISLRNANAVLIFDPVTLKLKRMIRDQFVRQHDPDFLDGDHITVFDNHNISDVPGESQSRLLEIDLRTGATKILFEGAPNHPFFTRYMGRQQRLADGGYLLDEAAEGRLLEIGPDGKVRWEYRNTVAPGFRAQLFDAFRIDRAPAFPAC